MSTFKSRTLSVTINRNWRDVYSYAAEPANMVHWAAGLGAGFEGEGLEWKAHGAGGTAVRIRFTQRNEFGVLDHDVFVDGRIVHVPLRVMPNGDGTGFLSCCCRRRISTMVRSNATPKRSSRTCRLSKRSWKIEPAAGDAGCSSPLRLVARMTVQCRPWPENSPPQVWAGKVGSPAVLRTTGPNRVGNASSRSGCPRAVPTWLRC